MSNPWSRSKSSSKSSAKNTSSSSPGKSSNKEKSYLVSLVKKVVSCAWTCDVDRSDDIDHLFSPHTLRLRCLTMSAGDIERKKSSTSDSDDSVYASWSVSRKDSSYFPENQFNYFSKLIGDLDVFHPVSSGDDNGDNKYSLFTLSLLANIALSKVVSRGDDLSKEVINYVSMPEKYQDFLCSLPFSLSDGSILSNLKVCFIDVGTTNSVRTIPFLSYGDVPWFRITRYADFLESVYNSVIPSGNDNGAGNESDFDNNEFVMSVLGEDFFAKLCRIGTRHFDNFQDLVKLADMISESPEQFSCLYVFASDEIGSFIRSLDHSVYNKRVIVRDGSLPNGNTYKQIYFIVNTGSKAPGKGDSRGKQSTGKVQNRKVLSWVKHRK